MRTWFAERGYILNRTTYTEQDHAKAQEPMSTFSGDISYPYSYVGGCRTCKPTCALPRHSHVSVFTFVGPFLTRPFSATRCTGARLRFAIRFYQSSAFGLGRVQISQNSFKRRRSYGKIFMLWYQYSTCFPLVLSILSSCLSVFGANIQNKYYYGVIRPPVLGFEQQKMYFTTFDACSRLISLSSHSILRPAF